MADIKKPLSERDANQTLQSAYNLVDATISTNGFLVGKVGNRVVRVLVDPITEYYSFYDQTSLLYTYRIIYTDATLGTLSSAERIA